MTTNQKYYRRTFCLPPENEHNVYSPARIRGERGRRDLVNRWQLKLDRGPLFDGTILLVSVSNFHRWRRVPQHSFFGRDCDTKLKNCHGVGNYVQ